MPAPLKNQLRQLATLSGSQAAQHAGLSARTVQRAKRGLAIRSRQVQVDVVRSGTVTPTANCAIGMTYLPAEGAKPGTRFTIDVRGKRAPAEVVALPFVPRRTKK